MSLRELPPKQSLSQRWDRLRYVPLIILALLSLVAAIIGAVTVHRQSAVATKPPSPASIQSSPSSKTDGALPPVCHPTVQPPPQQPWLGSESDRANAEAVWNGHQAELAQPYVLEKDGWVDWGDIQAANFSQALGKRNLSTVEAKQWHDHLAKLRDGLAAMNIPLYVVVTPAKWDVYPQQLPDWAQKIRGSGPLDQLQASFPDLPIIDIRAQLRTASETHQTYSKTNSHWTDYGAWVGWQAISRCIVTTSPSLSGLSAPPIDRVTISADANEFAKFGIPDPAPNVTTPVYVSALKPVTVTTNDGVTATVAGTTPTDLLKLPAETTTADSQTTHTALFVRDSFGSSLSIPVMQSFARTWQVRHNLDAAPSTQPDILALAEEHHPDVVVLQIAQRHLNFPPSS